MKTNKLNDRPQEAGEEGKMKNLILAVFLGAFALGISAMAATPLTADPVVSTQWEPCVVPFCSK